MAAAIDRDIESGGNVGLDAKNESVSVVAAEASSLGIDPTSTGTITLEGVPLEQSPLCPGNDLGNTDTIVRRLNDTPPLFPPNDQAQVDIQIVELHLQSVEPFQVDSANTRRCTPGE